MKTKLTALLFVLATLAVTIQTTELEARSRTRAGFSFGTRQVQAQPVYAAQPVYVAQPVQVTQVARPAPAVRAQPVYYTPCPTCRPVVYQASAYEPVYVYPTVYQSPAVYQSTGFSFSWGKWW